MFKPTVYQTLPTEGTDLGIIFLEPSSFTKKS